MVWCYLLLRKKMLIIYAPYPPDDPLFVAGLRQTFNKLQQSLEDANSAVVSCAVNVITELSDKNPRNYLHLGMEEQKWFFRQLPFLTQRVFSHVTAPTFFLLLSRSSNNWMLIKVVKLLGSLVPEEPRLARCVFIGA
jgi:AP-3 complex subunit delta